MNYLEYTDQQLEVLRKHLRVCYKDVLREIINRRTHKIPTGLLRFSNRLALRLQSMGFETEEDVYDAMETSHPTQFLKERGLGQKSMNELIYQYEMVRSGLVDKYGPWIWPSGYFESINSSK